MIKLFVGCMLERIYLELKEREKRHRIRFIKVNIHVFMLQVSLISRDPVFLGHSKYQRLHMERLDLMMFHHATSSTYDRAGMDDKLHERATRRVRERAGTGTDRGRR